MEEKTILTRDGRDMQSGHKWRLTWHTSPGAFISHYAEIYIYDGATDEQLDYAQFENKSQALAFLKAYDFMEVQ